MLKSILIGSLIILFGALSIVAQDLQHEIIVNTEVMTSIDDGNCSLIEAITAVKLNRPSGDKGGECIPSQEEPIILLQSNTSYVISEVNNTTENGINGLPLIDVSVTIRGNNGTTIVRDNNSDDFRFFEVSELGSLYLEQINFENGASAKGGAIFNMGDLSLNDTSFISNSSTEAGGAIYNAGQINAIDVEFEGNRSFPQQLQIENPETIVEFAGGAIFNGLDSTALIRDGSFKDNGARGYGGGIFNLGTAIIHNSEFSENKALRGGGVYSWELLNLYNTTLHNNESLHIGGGIDNWGIAFATNVEINANSSTWGGGISNNNWLTLANATITNNTSDLIGGGVYNNGILLLENTNIIENQSDDGGGIYNLGEILMDELSSIVDNTAINGSNNLADLDPQN